MKKHRHYLYLLASPWLSLATHAQADEQPPSPLEAIEIEASSDSEDSPYQHPHAVSRLGREQLDRLPARHAADILETMAGVYSPQSSFEPGLAVNIRGMQDFGRVNMMIDGMRQNYGRNGHQQRNSEMFIDPELLREVIVHKGPNGGSHGALAVAGSADFRTLEASDILAPGQEQGLRLRASSGLGGRGNGIHFIGSGAFASRLGEQADLLYLYSERNLGDYRIGRRGADHWRNRNHLPDTEPARFTGQGQHSHMLKFGWQISPQQHLQLSHLQSSLHYQNAAEARRSLRQGTTLDTLGDSRVDTYSSAIHYRLEPDSPWLDIEAKLYNVRTTSYTYTPPRDPDMSTWWGPYCLQTPIPSYADALCPAAFQSRVRTDTLGLLLTNQSVFQIGGQGQLTWQQGLETFQDKSRPKAVYDRYRTSDPSQRVEGLNPEGERWVASLFNQLSYAHGDWLHLAAGLRHDHYLINGKTAVPAVGIEFESRQQRWDSYVERAYQSNNQLVINMIEEGRLGAHFSMFDPRYFEYSYMDQYDLDRHQQAWLPTLSAAIKPWDWLQLYANWGKSWRPAGLTETLMGGTIPGHGFTGLFPNPNLKPERSRTWELGLNLHRQGLLKPHDQGGLKLTYFDSRLDHFLYTSMSNALPGSIGGSLGQTAFVNNLRPTRFRGIELEASYDSGLWYTGLNYTWMLGNRNQFCQKWWYLGSGDNVVDQDWGDIDTAQTRRMKELLQTARDAGYDSYKAYLDDMQLCGAIMNSAEHKPMDRGSLHAGIRLDNQRLDLGLRLRYSANLSSNHIHGEASEFITIPYYPSYTLWDLHASYQLGEHLTLRAALENLRDTTYWAGMADASSRTAQPGRTLTGGIEVRF